jgi:hypothetical protein
MKFLNTIIFLTFLLSLAGSSVAEPSAVPTTTKRVMVVESDPRTGFVTVTVDGSKSFIDAHMADVRSRQASGRITRKSLADIKPGMHATITGYWYGLPTLVTKIVIDTK